MQVQEIPTLQVARWPQKKEERQEQQAKEKYLTHCKKFHLKKPHQVKLDKCMWNKKYKGYRLKLICDELEVATLSQPNAPTHYDVRSPTQQIEDNKTIIPAGPREHCRQQKAAQCQHIKQTLQRLCKCDDLLLDNSITQVKDERTAIAKNNTNNAKRVAINSTHAQLALPTIRLAQHG
jgi:hypothetical protein